MKKIKIICSLTVLTVIASLITLGAFAVYTPITPGSLEKKLTGENEMLIMDTAFDGIASTGLGTSSTDIRVSWLSMPQTWVKHGNNSGVTFYDYCANSSATKDANGKYLIPTPDSATPTVSVKDGAIVWSAAPKKPAYDDNNCIDLRLDDKAKSGQSFVLSLDVKMNTDSLSAGIPLFTIYNNNASSQLVTRPVYLQSSGTLTADSAGAVILGQLDRDEYTTVTVHVRITKSTAIDNGSLVYDVYLDGKQAAFDLPLLTAAEQASLATLDKSNFDTADELERNKNFITGKADDYKITYFRFLNANGNLQGEKRDYNGEELYSLSALRVYYSDVCYETADFAATLTGHSVTIGDGILGLNHYFKFGDRLLAEENAEVVFTSPAGRVSKVPLSHGVKESNGSYRFTSYVSSVEMSDKVTAQIKSGNDVYNIYVGDAIHLSTEYSVTEYSAAIMENSLYSASVKGLVRAMLNYGAYAQNYFGISTDNLANKGYAYTTELDSVADLTEGEIVRVSGSGKITATLVLDTTIAIRIYKNSVLIGEKSGIYATDLDTPYTVGNGEDSVTVSVLAIAEKVVAGNYSESYKALAKAIKLYYDAAIAYRDTPEVYDITSLKVAGADLGDFVIVADVDNFYVSDVAEKLRTTLALKSGILLPIVSPEAANGRSIFVRLVGDAGEGGFRVSEKNGDLYIECAHKKRFASATEEFLCDTVSTKAGSVEFKSGYIYTKVINTVSYKDFGAVGDGVTDDYDAIRNTHLEANAEGYKVFAESGKTYYLPPHTVTIPVQTDVDWSGAKFIIDDRTINYNGHAAQNTSLFSVNPELKRFNLSVPSLKKGQTNIGVAPGVDCMLFISYNGATHYIRYGANANNGAKQQEVILVKANGDVDATTPIAWDYPEVNGCYAIPTGEKPITIQGGDFKTLANEINPDKYISVARNINITRSNVTVKGVNHTVEQVQSYRAAYAGFFRVSYCSDILIYDCEIFCHKSSYFTQYKGDGTTQQVLLGSYEISGGHAINVTYEKVVQTNLFDPDGSLHDQGLMGTNYCRNMYFLDSTIARFDAHSGLYNVTVKGSKIQRVNAIGGGTIRIEDTQVYGNFMVDLRSDYGGHFDGDVYLKNVTMMNPAEKTNIALFSGSWANHFFGYTVVQPQNIYVENMKVLGPTNTIYLFTSGLDGKPDLTADTVNGETNLNPIIPTKQIMITSNPAGTDFVINSGDTFKNTKVNNVATDDTRENIEYTVFGAFGDNYSKNADGYITSTSTTPNGSGSVVFQLEGNGHVKSNLRAIKHEGNQSILFSGCGNPGGATKHTNLCIDLRPGKSTSPEQSVFDKYHGKSFVVEYEFTPIAQTTTVHDGLNVTLFQFTNNYSTQGGFVAGTVVSMKMSDFSLHIGAHGQRASKDLNTKLIAGVKYTLALHVNVSQNTCDFYLDGNCLSSDMPFMSTNDIQKIAAYNFSGTLVASTKANKMEDAMITYARIAMINAWAVNGDVYIVDNARLYYSNTYQPPVK